MKQHRLNKRHPRQRQGVVLPLLAVVLTAILIVVALAINSNWLLYSQINAQNTADITARSTLAKILADTDPGDRVARARTLGKRLYDANLDRPNVDFDGSRIEFGEIVDQTVLEPEFRENTSVDDAVSAVFVDTPLQQQEVNVFFANMMGRERVRIVADATVSTRPVDIMLCLDVSRSMNRRSSNKQFPPGGSTIHEPPLPGSRYFELRDTVVFFLEALREINPNARVGLVTFGGGYATGQGHDRLESPLDLEWARLDQDLTTVVAPQIDGIVETLNSYIELPALGLGTSHFDGVDISIDFLDNQNSTRHMIMLSDGSQATRNERPDVRVAAADAARANITIHTISFGGDLATMEDISDLTGGSNFTALSEEELREAFAQLLARFRVELVD